MNKYGYEISKISLKEKIVYVRRLDNEKVIEVKNLTKEYKNLKAIDNLSLMFMKEKY